MKMINNILILIIIIFVINYLTEGQIFDFVSRFFSQCSSNVEHFMGVTHPVNCIKPNVPIIPFAIQKDFAYINQSDIKNLDEETYRLYRFINDLVTVNVNFYELTPSDGTRVEASPEFTQEILNHLNKIFNCKGYKFENIKILEPLYYYKNPRGKELEMFNISADVSYLSNKLGSVMLNLDCFLREDRIFNKQTDSGYLTLIDIKLVKRIKSKPDSEFVENPKKVPSYTIWEPPTYVNESSKNIVVEPTKSQVESQKKHDELKNKMNDSFNDHFVSRESYDDLFIKPQFANANNKDYMLDNNTEDLIPSVIEFSAYEK